MYSDLTTNNPSFLKRFSHARRFDLALELLAVDGEDNILDYGTGDGFMLRKLHSRTRGRIVGYEPMEDRFVQLQEAVRDIPGDRVSVSDDPCHLTMGRFDKICCLEVLEHLNEDGQRSVLSSIDSLLEDAGLVVVSVPIEVGVSGLLKNLARWVLGQKEPEAGAMNILKSFLGMKIDRRGAPYILSHIGFDYHALKRLFPSTGFRIRKVCYSPFKGLGRFLNSQVFFVLVKTHIPLPVSGPSADKSQPEARASE